VRGRSGGAEVLSAVPPFATRLMHWRRHEGGDDGDGDGDGDDDGDGDGDNAGGGEGTHHFLLLGFMGGLTSSLLREDVVIASMYEVSAGGACVCLE
jgi:hypothetical protein